MIRSLLLAGAAALSATAVQAQSIEGVTTGFGLSSLGLYGSAAFEVTPGIRARGVLAGLPTLTYDESDDDMEASASLSSLGLAALADYRPMANGLRVSGGLYLGQPDLSFEMSSRPGRSIKVGDESYSDARFEADVAFRNPVSPMVAAGYEARLGGGWALDAEIGAILFGGFEVNVDGENIPMRDLRAEAAEIEDELSSLKAYPWIAIGVAYAF